MSFFALFKGSKKAANPTAHVAKDRLQLILINERGIGGVSPDYLPRLQKELIEVISRYVNIEPNDIQVHLDRQDALEVLEVKIELPHIEAEQKNKPKK